MTFVSDPGLQPSYIKLTNLFPGAVAANQGFTPGSVTVNSNTDYTFTANTAGSDKISGTTGLSKSGTGTLTISLSNTYSGTTNLTGGTIVLANSAALGTGSMTINGGTLDLHNNSLGSKAITVQGAGVGGLGAIVNNSTSAHTAYQNDISNITLSGDTTFGGVGVADTVYNAGLPANTVGRWDFYNAGGSNTLIGNSHTLTKTGATTILMVDMTADSTTTDFVINEGILGLERGTSMGSSAGTITVNGAGAGQPTTRLDNSQPGGGSILQMNNLTIPLNKHVSLSNNGQIYVMQNDADSNGGDIISGPIAVADSGGVLNAGGVRADIAANANARMFLTGSITGGSGATLTKTGPGTVTLSGSSSFSGTTVVNDGTLILSNPVTPAYLGGGVTLTTAYATTGITPTLIAQGTIAGTLTDSANVLIAIGASKADGNVGTLNLGGLTLTGGSQINYDLSVPALGSDLININGNLSLSGVTNIAVPNIATMATNSYRLMNYTGSKSGTGSFALLNVPANTRRTFTVNTSVPQQVNFSLSGPIGNLVWTGTGSTQWNVKTDHNWLNGATADIFYNLDNVTFSNGSNRTVNITSTDVWPLSITVNSGVGNDYTFAGTYKISGVASLTKTGASKLTIANGGGVGETNDFTGPITIAQGTVQVGDGSTTGVTIGTGAIANSGQLVFNQPDSWTISNNISGTGTLEQKGAGIITLTGTNTYSGVTTITSGTLQAGTTSPLGSTASGTTIANGATLDINNFSLGDESVTVQGTGVGGLGAIVNNNTVSSTVAQLALRFVTLADNATIGGQAATDPTLGGTLSNSGRWEIRGSTSEAAAISTGGNAYSITKVGNNQVSFVRCIADSALGDINVNQGILDLISVTSVGDPAHSINVASGATIQVEGLTITLNKKIMLDGGNVYAVDGSADVGYNTISGTISVTDSMGTGNGSTLNIGGTRSDYTTANTYSHLQISGVVQNAPGGTTAAIITKLGPGPVTFSNPANTFNGTMLEKEGSVIVTGTWAGGITMYQATPGVVLSGTGSINGPVSDSYGTNIAPGVTASSGAVGTLTFGNNLSLGTGGSGTLTAGSVK